MEQNRITYLHQQYLDQRLSSQELQEWKSILADPQHEPLLKELMKETWEGLKNTTLEDMVQAKSENLLQEIVSQPQFREKRRLWPKWAVAASVAIAVMVGGYFYYNADRQPKTELAYKNDVAPGKDGATLTLADGRKILVSDALAGNIATQSGVRISKDADGQLIYELTGNGQADRTEFNTLNTARGEQTRVRLPDGTLVFLNAASSLMYPTSFGRERNVELIGEAYFQVAHDKTKPFRVTSRGQQVEVLGTHFNINSYADEKDTRTTLLEGSVRLNGTTVLKPGEQAALSRSGAISVEQVEVEDVIAWTDGKFIFDGETIESIMRKLSRWYDVQVVYEGNVKDKKFAGTISRRDNISKILDKITFTKAARFKIEGRRITVMP